MNKEQVEEIIKNIAESGHVLENKTITDTSVSLIYYNCNFSLNLKGAELVVEVNIAFGYHTLFDQEDVDWLNSITFKEITCIYDILDVEDGILDIFFLNENMDLGIVSLDKELLTMSEKELKQIKENA